MSLSEVNEIAGTAIVTEVKNGTWLVNFPGFALWKTNQASFKCQHFDFVVDFGAYHSIHTAAVSVCNSSTWNNCTSNISVRVIFNGSMSEILLTERSRSQRVQWDVTKSQHCSLQLVIELIDVIAEGQRNILTHLSKLFENKTMADVRFIVKDEEMAAHVGVLATSSPVMAAMLADDRFIEGQTKEVRIEDMEPQVFKEMLRYLYTGTVACLDEPDMAEPLFLAADRFQIESLRAICIQKLLKQLKFDNCIRNLVVGHLHSVPDLFEASLQCLELNKTRVWDRPDWQALGENYPNLFFQASRRMVIPTVNIKTTIGPKAHPQGVFGMLKLQPL